MSDPGAGPAGTEPERVEDVCRAFVEAVAWGEHRKVWEMLGAEARGTVLRVATARGMDEALSMRLQHGTASLEESDQFLTDLVQGIRTDLEGNDLDALDYVADPEASDANRARVVLFASLPEPLAARTGGLPVGSIEVATDAGGRWRVERLVPRPGR